MKEAKTIFLNKWAVLLVGLLLFGGAGALFEEYKSSGAKVRNPPANFPWAYEMQIEDLDGNVLRMGSDPKPGGTFGEWRGMRGDLWVMKPEGEWRRVRQECSTGPRAKRREIPPSRKSIRDAPIGVGVDGQRAARLALAFASGGKNRPLRSG